LGHRERLRQKFLQDKLADYELLELLLTYAIPRCDVKPFAKELIKTFGGPAGVLAAPMEALTAVWGVKENAAVLIRLIHKLMLLGYRDHLSSTPVFHDYNKLSEYCRLSLSGKSVEELHVLYLDADFKLLSDDLHSSGTVDWAAIYPREIVKRALVLNARSVVMAHNHPTTGQSFSSADIRIIEEITDLLEPVSVSVFDHILVSGNIVYSARNMFLIKDRKGGESK
jgi:DNA repair protein RadC